MVRAQVGGCAFNATNLAGPSVRVKVKVGSILTLSSDIITKMLGEDRRFPDLDAPETKALRTVPAEQFLSRLQVS